MLKLIAPEMAIFSKKFDLYIRLTPWQMTLVPADV